MPEVLHVRVRSAQWDDLWLYAYLVWGRCGVAALLAIWASMIQSVSHYIIPW